MASEETCDYFLGICCSHLVKYIAKLCNVNYSMHLVRALRLYFLSYDKPGR